MAEIAQKLTSREIQFTYEDYLLLPDDGKRYEIIEGELFMTPAPVTKHQNILIALGKHLFDFVEKNKLGVVFLAPYDVILSKTNVVQPDIVYVSHKNRHIITEKNIQGSPDLTVEIISANTRECDTVLKKKLYARFEVKEYWIVFPDEEKIEIWQLQNKNFVLTEEFQKSDLLTTSLLPGLQIPLKEVFRSLDDYFKK
ncbi:MAG: Uma2 family endonuclease [Calditrichaeota bacterium]|nr:MAG: Uma2 family endonuclease [Calditrichota bacterium]